MSTSLKELADLVGGELKGDPNITIAGAADIADAVEGDIVFAESPRHMHKASNSCASAIIAYNGANNSRKPMISVQNPRYAFAQVLNVFSPARSRTPGIHSTSLVGTGATIGDNPSIGFNVCIGQATSIGNNAWIYPFVCIGDDVRIGNDCIIYPMVTIYGNVTIGDGVIIHSGTVIGSDGFGYTRVGEEHYKIPQIGTVIIGDNVEIGASVSIDRARTGKTQIGRGTKIDNHVHIAHNVTVGENCIIVAQVGISGSVEIGDRVVMAGQAGVKDHVSIGNDTIVCARAGIIGNIGPGEFVSGYPARPHREQLRTQAAQQRLPELLRQVRDLEKRVKELEDRSK